MPLTDASSQLQLRWQQSLSSLVLPSCSALPTVVAITICSHLLPWKSRSSFRSLVKWLMESCQQIF
jgi:hypothetical protein